MQWENLIPARNFSKEGAWHEKIAVYTQEDVADIIKYASTGRYVSGRDRLRKFKTFAEALAAYVATSVAHRGHRRLSPAYMAMRSHRLQLIKEGTLVKDFIESHDFGTQLVVYTSSFLNVSHQLRA